MLEANMAIKCSVANCKHFDKSSHCKLKTITVGGESSCSDCRETECKSFELNI